jgi:hypothetical protein
LAGDFTGDFTGDFNGDLMMDLTVDFNADRITERTMDFIADAPFLLERTLLVISFNFLSLILSRDSTLNAILDFFAMTAPFVSF